MSKNQQSEPVSNQQLTERLHDLQTRIERELGDRVAEDHALLVDTTQQVTNNGEGVIGAIRRADAAQTTADTARDTARAAKESATRACDMAEDATKSALRAEQTAGAVADALPRIGHATGDAHRRLNDSTVDISRVIDPLAAGGALGLTVLFWVGLGFLTPLTGGAAFLIGLSAGIAYFAVFGVDLEGSLTVPDRKEYKPQKQESRAESDSSVEAPRASSDQPTREVEPVS